MEEKYKYKPSNLDILNRPEETVIPTWKGRQGPTFYRRTPGSFRHPTRNSHKAFRDSSRGRHRRSHLLR